MKSVFLLSLIHIFSISYGQLSDIPDERIDQLVMEYDHFLYQNSADESMEYVPHLKISSHLIKRAIGSVDHMITIYFDRNDEIVETETESAEVYRTIIRKVNFTIKSGSYHIEYIYNFDSDGNFMLATEKTVDAHYGCSVKNYYFENDICFKVINRPVETEACESNIAYQERSELNDDDMKAIEIIQSEVQKMRKILALNYSVMMGN